MGKLIYLMNVSLDGYVEDMTGDFTWGMPSDPGVHAAINQLAAGFGT